MKPVILLLSTYSYTEPRHGGQVRLANIAKTYQDEGFLVENIAIYDDGGNNSATADNRDIAFPSTSPYRKYKGIEAIYANDFLSGLYASEKNGGFLKVINNLPKKIDAIHVEQPWLWDLATKIKKFEAYRNTLLIYGSQNIEAPLKREIFNNLNYRYADELVLAISALEKRAALEADLVIAVTQSDHDKMASWGATNIIISMNGIASWKASDKALSRWKSLLPKSPWLLYVASGHPPNYIDVATALGGSLACIPPDSKLVIAGSVGSFIYKEFENTDFSCINLSKLQVLNELSDDNLAAVKSLAHGFLLPITQGGGSNIKTAEALYSGAYVIGSEIAFRGYEEFSQLPEVTIAKSPEEFHHAIKKVLDQNSFQNTIDKKQQDFRKSLLWQETLANMATLARALVIKRNVSV
tara:strand:- start:2040 stop:3272 length:1233 start_codon:yes stop_codon:yes gene_type:complete